ncbi:MAG: UDP-N-acetylglucosamine 2-epimerase (hydrolyzing) [Candidatus Omnitrophica bacterium]|nr:UDP-N-acetylglucosamine 2-epimerase (hydrolyzing) [Candidatus Omnitrophota bacterium]
MKRRICVFTGTRAEYGLLRPLMEEIQQDASLQLQLIVSGAHLSKEFGSTYRHIEEDGMSINFKIPIPLDCDTSVGLSTSIGTAVIKYSKAFESLRPDILVLLGDRYEVFAAAIAAMTARIPIAHLHGGEATYGLMDEAMRHAITKMSHLHFTSTEAYRRKVIQMGELPSKVFNVGAIGLDNLRLLKLLSREQLESNLNMRFGSKNFLITFHPVTLEKDSERQFSNLLSVLGSLKETHLIFTKANADPLGRRINTMIDRFVRSHAKIAFVYASLGQLRYLSMMKLMDAVVGNSSSGIIEAPSFNIGTIDVGQRQMGRITASSVIHCGSKIQEIRSALRKLSTPAFQGKLKSVVNPYGDGQTAARIKRVLKSHSLNSLIMKSFHELPVKKG